MAGALLQHDPQALLFHAENPITRFEDLDGKRIMAGSGTAFVELLRSKYQIDFEILPLDYGLGQFLRDKNFIQQCFITSEPYFAKQQGANPGTLLIKESGLDPYHVWYTRTDFALKYPELVEKFTRATIRGWQDYLFGDRTKTNALLASLNPKLDEEFMAYSVGALIEYNLVTGSTGDPSVIGEIDTTRIQAEVIQLQELGFLKMPVEAESVLAELSNIK
jgi:NitT/TauT family transport system substrate-binding protein